MDHVPPQFKKDKRPIVTSRRTLLRIHEEAAALAEREIETISANKPDAASLGALRLIAQNEHDACHRFRNLITVREQDPRYLITVRRIGAGDDGKTFDPSLVGQIAAQERSLVFLARDRARKWLEKNGQNIEPDTEAKKGSVTLRMEDDPQWVKDAYEILKAKFLAGVVGGMAELERVYELGFEVGNHELGSAFLRQAVEEVEDFNTVSAQKKSA